MKKKIYAVWFPGQEKEAVFYDNWESCKSQIDGVSGVRYRGFPDQEHAEEFLGIREVKHGTEAKTDTLFPDQESKNNLAIYVDGSYTPKCPYAGWAWVALSIHHLPSEIHEQKLGQDSGTTSEPATSNNIDGEITAVLKAMEWVENYFQSEKKDWSNTRLVILYDYMGIEKWAQGNWKAKTPISQSYQREMMKYRNRIHFQKVAAHSGKKWNEYVDLLAKESIQKKIKDSFTG